MFAILYKIIARIVLILLLLFRRRPLYDKTYFHIYKERDVNRNIHIFLKSAPSESSI